MDVGREHGTAGREPENRCPGGAREWDGLPLPRRLWAILAVAFGVSLSVLDGSIANVALPSIAADLNVSSPDAIWVVNAYQLAIVITLLSFSALGDLWGYRKIYLFGLVLFTAASLGSAVARSLPWLALARAVQGFGAAAITSVNTTLIRLIYPKHSLGKGMGINATVVAISAVAGPTIAAGILSFASWPWLFAVNIPVGVIAIALSSRFLPDNPERSGSVRFDWRDGAMNALTFGLMIAVIEGYSHDLPAVYVASGAVLFLAASFVFVRGQLRKPFPILPVDLLRIPIFTLSVCTSICSFLAQMLAMVSLPFLFQHRLGYTEVDTGLLMTAWPAVITIVAPAAGILVTRIHAGVLGVAGLLSMASGLFLLAFLPEDPARWDIVWRMALCGFGFGLFQSPNNSIIIASAPARRSGGASGMLATARLIGQTTGAALVAALFHFSPENGTHTALLMAGGFALLGALLSGSRASMALPAALTVSRKR